MTAALGATAGWKPRFGNLARLAALLSGSLGSSLLAFLTQLALTRSLGLADYGRLVALIAVINILQIFAGYGVGWFWLQLFGREGWAGFRWVGPTIRLLAIAAAAGTLLLGAYVFFGGAGSGSERGLVYGLATAVLLGQTLADTTGARLQLEERYLCLAVWQSVTQAGRFLAVLCVLLCGVPDLLHVLGGYAAVGLVTMAVSLLSLNQVRRKRIALIGHARSAAAPPQRRVTLMASFTGATPYCFSTVFYLLYSQGVVVIVERVLGPRAAAMYYVAFLIVSATYLLPSVVYMKFLVGKIFRWWEQDRRLFAAAVHVGVVLGALAGLCCMLVVIVAAPLVMPRLFGARYAAAIPILMLLSFAIPIRFAQHAFGSAFFSEENMKRKVWYLGAAALSCLFWSLLLIPPLGVRGAAAASVLAEASLLGFYVWGVVRHVDPVDLRSLLSIAKIRGALAYVGDAQRIGERSE
jgi:O-antigen/teichoic acid export membrane protein